jgi:hypothetical protein
MRKLTENEYNDLKTNWSEQLELVKHKIVGRGVQKLIPLYESLTGTKLNINCDSCKFDMMVVISIAYKNYTPANIEKPKRKKK